MHTNDHRPDSPFAHPRRRRWGRGTRLAVASTAVAGLALGVAGTAGATTTPSGNAPPHAVGRPPDVGSPPTAAGTVETVGTGTFTLLSRDKTTVTVDVSSTTTYVDPKITAPSLADVTVGEPVAVVGTEVSDTVTATTVLVGLPTGTGSSGRGPGGKPPAGSGTVGSPGTPPAG